MNTITRKDGERTGLYALAAIAAFALLCAVFFFVSYGYIGNDEGNYLYEAGIALHGKVPFKDFPSRSPFQLVLMMAAAKILGMSMLSVKIYELILFALTGILAYLIIRTFEKRRIAFFGALIALATPTFFLSKLVLATTNLNIVLVLAAFYALRRKESWMPVLAGALLALAVFTRETTAFFIIAYFVYLIWQKDWRRLGLVSLGGAIVSVPVLAYFASQIGFAESFIRVLGVGHVMVQEKLAVNGYSVYELAFFLLSILPFLAAALFAPRKKDAARRLPPLELIWIGVMALFYGLYIFKRAFMQSYGSEFIPFMAIALCAVIDFDSAKAPNSRLQGALFTTIVVFAFLYGEIMPLSEKYELARQGRPLSGFSLMRDFEFLAGSGIPRDNFERLKAAVLAHSSPGDSVLSGTMAIPIETGLVQFGDITRMLIYEDNSDLYRMYNVPDREGFLKNFTENPPRIIVADHHLNISFIKDFKQFVDKNYSVIYGDNYALAFVRKY